MIPKQQILNFTYFCHYNFNNFNIFILINNCKNYNLLLNLLKNKNNIFILSNLNNFRYIWSENYNFNKYDTKINYIFTKNFRLFNNYTEKKTEFPLNNIINFKKKTSMFKKNSDINYIILSKININRVVFNKKINLYNQKSAKNNNYLNKFLNFNKSLDLSKKTKLIFKKNRKIAKDFFNIKQYRSSPLSKNLKKICNFKKKDLYLNLDKNLFNILMSSDFFFSTSDCKWFLKNSLISVNSVIIKNSNFLLKPFDIINLSNNNYYFKYYKINYNYLLKNFYKINLKFWSINKNRFKNTGFKENFPSWIENYKYFKKDIPLYLEVDYISMTIVLLTYNFNFKNVNYYNFKFINFYLNRLYNWKFII